MITAHPSAPLGSVTHAHTYDISDFLPTSAILCRNTAPLLAFVFSLIERGIGVHVLGRDIGTGLLTTIESCRATTLLELEQKLLQKRNREAGTLFKQGNETGAAAVNDRYDCIDLFVRRAKAQGQTDATFLDYLTNTITYLFDPARAGLLTLSTIHKAKGLEWPKVFILDAKRLMPSKWATLPWQKSQERNLYHVAITRAMVDLVYISSNCWRKEGDEICPTQVVPKSLDSRLGSNPLPTFDPDAVECFFPDHD